MFPFTIQIFKQYFLVLLLFGMLFLPACNEPSLGGGTEAATTWGEQETSIKWDELETYIKTEFSESALPYDAYEFDTGPVPVSFSEVANSAENSEFSQTNIQETGVDEADKVKTDGTYLYIAGDKVVHIVNAVPADSMNILSTINVNGDVDSLYLSNNKLIILYRYNEGSGLTCEITLFSNDVFFSCISKDKGEKLFE